MNPAEIKFEREPITVTCPHCSKTEQTIINRKVGTFTHVIAVVFCIFGCCICAGMTYCFAYTKDVQHQCRYCKAYLGRYCVIAKI